MRSQLRYVVVSIRQICICGNRPGSNSQHLVITPHIKSLHSTGRVGTPPLSTSGSTSVSSSSGNGTRPEGMVLAAVRPAFLPAY